MCAEYYLPLAQLLADRGVAVQLVTLPGYNGTEPIPDLNWERLLETLLPVVSKHRALIGHSLGGLCSIPLAAKLGDDLDHLILMEPGVVPWKSVARFGAWWYRRSVVDRKEPEFKNRGPWYWRIHDPDRFPPEAMEIVLRSDASTDIETPRGLTGRFADLYPLPFEDIRAKTLMVRGGSSGVMMAWGSWLVGRRLEANYAVIPDAGHWMANEQDALLAEAIGGFLEDSGNTVAVGP